jgi:hypothetical protein
MGNVQSTPTDGKYTVYTHPQEILSPHSTTGNTQSTLIHRKCTVHTHPWEILSSHPLMGNIQSTLIHRKYSVHTHSWEIYSPHSSTGNVQAQEMFSSRVPGPSAVRGLALYIPEFKILHYLKAPQWQSHG